jgi:non-heme chloroperoxidase
MASVRGVNDRAAFFYELTAAFYGYNRPGAKESKAVRESFVEQGLQGSIKALYDCIHAFSKQICVRTSKR